MADCQPYLLRSASDDVVELPIELTLDDWPHYARPDLAYFIPPKSPAGALGSTRPRTRRWGTAAS
jgi:hypothetical protein